MPRSRSCGIKNHDVKASTADKKTSSRNRLQIPPLLTRICPNTWFIATATDETANTANVIQPARYSCRKRACPKPRETAHVHTHRKVLALDIRGRNVRRIRLAFNRVFDDPRAISGGIATLGAF